MTLVCHSSIYKLGQLSSHTTLHCVAVGSNTNSAMGSNTNSAMGSNTNSAISAQFTSSPYVRLMITFITDENVMVDETSANTETVFTKHSPQH